MAQSEMTGELVYAEVAGHASENFVMELMGTVFVYWLAHVWRLGAVLAFTLFVIVTVLDVLQVSAIIAFGHAREKKSPDWMAPEFKKWVRRGLWVRSASVVAASGLLWVLYRRLW